MVLATLQKAFGSEEGITLLGGKMGNEHSQDNIQCIYNFYNFLLFFFNFSFLYRATSFWNSLPCEIRECNNLPIFKRLLKELLTSF